MRSICFLLLCFFMIDGIAQTEAVNLETKEEGDHLQFWVSNTSDYPLEVELFVFNTKNLRGKKTIKAAIPANEKRLVEDMKIKGEYHFEYDLKKTYPKSALISNERKVGDVDLKEGIVVFYKEECPRCQFLLAYLIENHIDFQAMDLENRRNKKFMYKLLQNSGVYEKKVLTPIVVVDEQISFSHEDLEEFAATLK
ncbi:MAG TPA: hypothetical protein VFM70_08475 [Salinimicrobium sp.]|nr:hypothetical protein [Salinimicrobium sp.]